MGRVEGRGGCKAQLQVFRDRAEQARELARQVAGLLDQAVEKRGRASLVVSGGSTPSAFFEELSDMRLPWQRTTITLADERWLPPGNQQSNETLVRRHLLRGRAEAARFVGLYTGDASAAEAEETCCSRIRAIGLPFDVTVLGMGLDGHTASLFPGAEGVKEAVDTSKTVLCKAVRPVTAPHERMTLTLHALLSSRHTFLLICGGKKLKVLERALGEASEDEMPVRYVLCRSKRPVTVYHAP